MVEDELLMSPEADITTGQQDDRDISSLAGVTQEQIQQKLLDQQEAMTQLQAHAHAQQVMANHLNTTLRAKLRLKEQELKLIKCEQEQRMSAVLSHLLYLEGQMQKEHKEIIEALQDRDDVIRRQKAAIEDLTSKNNRYLQALKESHGYAWNNGLLKSYILQQNGNISIQDHGNKVILRTNKKSNGDKTPGFAQKVRFSGVKDMLRRHKSNLELSQQEPLETLMETTLKYGSEENLVVDRTAHSKLLDRKERCRSLSDYPTSLSEVDEAQMESPDSCFSEDFYTPTLTRNDSTSSLIIQGEKTARNKRLSSASLFGFHELSKSRSVPHALPTVSENDGSPSKVIGRPHSLPSVEMLAKNMGPTVAIDKTVSSQDNIASDHAIASSAHPTESNPFKSLKNVFMRKGSSKKKRASPLSSVKEQTDALKQHFKKYEMT